MSKGQSLIEVIFSVGLIVMVVTGVVVLMVNSLAARTKGFDRKKAVELAQVVMEGMVQQEATDGSEFWDLNSNYWLTNNSKTQTNSNYKGYTYVVDIVQFSGNGCSAIKFECATASVSVGWSGSATTDKFSRFFSRK
ncbi:hypothetical protein KBC75_04445 [Candidatus Shapirobacteria bacterium]|nr:hypothetical protein [Candidatus Shapirobacteria bacterium]